MPEKRTIILDDHQVEQKITRMAWQVYESCFEENEIIVVGVAKRGVVVAKRMVDVLEKISPLKVKVHSLQIDKKDPQKAKPAVSPEPGNLKNKTVILVDDVLNTGRTFIYAAKHLLDFPVKSIITVVLVDRKHRSFPIKADFVGLTLATTLQEHISVELGEKSAVFLE